MKPINFKLGVAILRVSSHRQKDNISHELQECEVQAYAAANGIAIEKVFRIVESAKDSEARKKYHSALQYALKNRIGSVLFYMLDREARNLTDNEANERLVRNGTVQIHYVKDGKVLKSDSPEFDFIMRDFMAVNNKQFSRVLSIKVNDAMTAKAEAGWFPNNHVPLGYVHKKIESADGRERKRGTVIVRDPNHRNVDWVKREFELRAGGYTYEQIRDIVVREGLVPTHRVRTYRANAIEKRIKNPFYFGQFKWQDKIYEGKHELIIPQPILDKIKDAKSKTYTKRFTADEGLLAGGFLKCADERCGCNLVYDPKIKVNKRTGEKRTFRYYHCTNGRRIHPSLRGMNVHEDVIWEQLGQSIDAITLSHDFAAKIAGELNRIETESRSHSNQEHDRLSASRGDLEARMNRLMDMYLDVQIDKELFEKQKARIKEQIAEVDRSLAVLSGGSGHLMETAESILELCKSAKSLWEGRSPRERRDFLNELLSNPRLRGRTVEYDLKKPFAILAEISKSEEWRPLRDSNSCLLRERELS